MHRIFQIHHIPPDEVYQKEWRFRAFMYASEEIMIEQEIKEEEKRKREARRGRKGGR